MKPQVYLISFTAIVILQTAVCAGTVPQKNFLAATPLHNVSPDRNNPANHIKRPNVEVPTKCVDDSTPASKITNKKYLRSLLQSSDDIWSAVKNSSYPSMLVTNIGNGIAMVAENLYPNQVRQSVNSTVTNMIDRLPLSQKIKTNMKKHTPLMINIVINYYNLLKNVDMARRTAQAASVLLSLATAFRVVLRDDAIIYDYNTIVMPSDAPRSTNPGDLVKSKPQEPKSEFRQITNIKPIADDKLSEQMRHDLNFSNDHPKLNDKNTSNKIQQNFMHNQKSSSQSKEHSFQAQTQPPMKPNEKLNNTPHGDGHLHEKLFPMNHIDFEPEFMDW